VNPVVAIVGSADPLRTYQPPVREPDLAVRAATELGRALAEQGFGIIVYSGDSGYIETSVVEGYVASGHARPGSILVSGKYGPGGPRFAGYHEHRELFRVLPTDSPDWEVGFFRSLIEADGLLAIGGGRSTFNAGLIAISLRRPVVALASFGGGAEKVWKILARDRGDVTDAELSLMADQWREDTASRLVTALADQAERRRQREQLAARTANSELRRTTLGLSIGLVLLVLMLALIPLYYAVPAGTVASMAVLSGAPLLAAACGAIVRAVSTGEDGWLRTSLLGSAAGVTVFLLFVAAQLTTSPDVLQGDGGRRLIFFVLPVAFVAGLTFDAVYAKLQAQDVVPAPASTGPPPNPTPPDAGNAVVRA
jgi:hypothetical protein